MSDKRNLTCFNKIYFVRLKPEGCITLSNLVKQSMARILNLKIELHEKFTSSKNKKNFLYCILL